MSVSLAERRLALRKAEPTLYPRDQAERLGVSECDVVAMDEAYGAQRLRPEMAAILDGIHTLGPVMALTRNADAVHEKTGRYGKLQGSGPVRLFLGEPIDLRLFLSGWAHAWAVQAPAGRRSLQFFGHDGAAVHKIYAVDETDLSAWMDLVAAHAATGADPAPAAIVPAASVAPTEGGIDVPGFLDGWDALRDTHEFHDLLTRHWLQRVQAFRLAGPARARPVRGTSLRDVLEHAAATALPIMVFVGNRGCIQIHTGPVHTIMASGPWFNVIDPSFNLHLRETAIDTAWVVAKPTDDGPVTSLELFDAGGQVIATLFGQRKPGQREDPAWRALLDSLV